MKTFLKILGATLVIVFAVLISLFVQNYSLVANWFKAPRILKTTTYNLTELRENNKDISEDSSFLTFNLTHMKFGTLKDDITYKVEILDKDQKVIEVSGHELSAETKIDKEFAGASFSKDISTKAYILTCNFEDGTILTIQFKCGLNEQGEYVNAKQTNFQINKANLSDFYDELCYIKISEVKA